MARRKSRTSPMTLSDNPSAPPRGNGSARGNGKMRAKPQAAVERRSGSERSLSVGALPARMPMGQFLFEYLHRRGVRHSFGVPGDFALPTFAWLDKSPIKSITMTHEPGAG